jgi:hypothetical protein
VLDVYNVFSRVFLGSMRSFMYRVIAQKLGAHSVDHLLVNLANKVLVWERSLMGSCLGPGLVGCWAYHVADLQPNKYHNRQADGFDFDCSFSFFFLSLYLVFK